MAEGDSTEAASARLLVDTASQLPMALGNVDRVANFLPTEEDFHFFTNFSEFREPLQSLQTRVQSLLQRFSSLNVLRRAPQWPSDPDDLNDWLVGVQDEIFEHVDASFDQFKKARAEKGVSVDDESFLYQSNRKRRRKDVHGSPADIKQGVAGGKDEKKFEKSPIRFHIWSIPRPQDKFNIAVDNSNTPFKHRKPQNVGSSQEAPVHPLQETIFTMKFEDVYKVDDSEPQPPKSLNDTPFTFVNSVAKLDEIAAKLSLEKEIAVDLENHQFRSFQGLTCLMQISTRTEDFIIDTLELHSQIGPKLRMIFESTAIQKVMHGATMDIAWLQRDFGVYVCNLFDTGQAARVLSMTSFGLAYLLEHFCGVIPDKRYQMADWRLRPLPTEMMKYAREDTHYLLYIADRMKHLLVSYKNDDHPEPLLEVYNRSRDICLRLYEKEITTESSYLQVFGLQEKHFRAEQLAVLSGLFAWRDQVARTEDESTGFVMPNHLLLKLAEEMPDNVNKLRSTMNSKNPLLMRNLVTIVATINKSRTMAENFKDVAARLEATSSENFKDVAARLEATSSNNVKTPQAARFEAASNKTHYHQKGHAAVHLRDTSLSFEEVPFSEDMPNMSIDGADNEEPASNVMSDIHHSPMQIPKLSTPAEESTKFDDVTAMPAVVVKRSTTSSLFGKPKKSNKTCQLQDLSGTLSSGLIKTVEDSKNIASALVRAESNNDPEQVTAMSKVEEIRASISLPFQLFGGSKSDNDDRCTAEQPNGKVNTVNVQLQQADCVTSSEVGIDGTSNGGVTQMESQPAKEQDVDSQHRQWWPDAQASQHGAPLPNELDVVSQDIEVPLSISQKYRPSRSQNNGMQAHQNLETRSPHNIQSKPGENVNGSGEQGISPFDYDTAKKKMSFLKGSRNNKDSEDLAPDKPYSGGSSKIFDPMKNLKEFKAEGIAPGKRRQVFPQTGNRTGVFK